MRAIWKGALTFGLVNVPVKVYSATEDHDVPLHQVHNKDGGRIRYQRICEIDGEVVPFADIDKAFDDGERTVVLTKEDIDSLPAEKSREIDVVEFVPTEQVDLLTLDRAYYLEPDSSSPKAYVLLLQTLLWVDEVREAAFPALDEPVRISAMELELSASLVESFAADFDPSEFSDEYQEELRTLIAAKIDQGDALDTSETFGDQEEETAGGEVIDLMAALRASVERSRAARSGSDSGGSKDAGGKAAAKTPAKSSKAGAKA